MSEQPWYILGAGAIGSLWASYWRRAGQPVVLLTTSPRNSEHLNLIKQGQSQQFSIESLSLSNLKNQQPLIHKLMISTKAQHTLAAVTAIQNHVADNASVLTVQNGITTDVIKKLLPKQQLFTAITSDGAYRTDKMTVVHAGHGTSYVGGEHSATQLQVFVEQLPVDSLHIEACDNIEQRQWLKLAINCAINGLTVIHHCRNGDLLNKPEALSQIRKICQEFTHVTVRLPQLASNHILIDWQKIYASVIATAEQTAENYSSMHQDIKQGNSTEIDYLNGYFCSQANRLNIACPENQAIVAAIKKFSH